VEYACQGKIGLVDFPCALIFAQKHVMGVWRGERGTPLGGSDTGEESFERARAFQKFYLPTPLDTSNVILNASASTFILLLSFIIIRHAKE
jgi:hypothetical protein